MIVDWANACARAAALRDAYYELVSGQATASFRYQANGKDREVTYARVDRDALYREWKNAEQQCDQLQSSGKISATIRTIRLMPSKGV